jgi:hypothetical protein
MKISSDAARTVADATVDYLCCSLGNSFTILALLVDFLEASMGTRKWICPGAATRMVVWVG